MGHSPVGANTQFSFNLFRELLLEDKDKNIFISPLSIILALAITYNGAVGKTSLNMAEALQFKNLDIEELNRGFYDLMLSIKNADSDIDLIIANSIWYRSGFKARGDFIERNKKYFDCEVNELDFSIPEAVAVTGVAVQKAIMSMEMIKFIVNRPFFFMISDDRSASILFMGKVVDI
ncbi:MAG: hypothetical protein M1365_08210 [Actinobacteria bacterium]|nr:hypothetical protein [Actinomycetota bacterium]